MTGKLSYCHTLVCDSIPNLLQTQQGISVFNVFLSPPIVAAMIESQCVLDAFQVQPHSHIYSCPLGIGSPKQAC